MIKVHKIAQLTGHTGAIYCLAFYKAERFFSAGFDNLVVEWDSKHPETAKAVAKLKSKAISLLYIKEKEWLIAGQSTGGVHIIGLSKREELHFLKVGNGMVFSLFYDKNLNRLLVGTEDGKLSVWDLQTIQLISIKQFEFGKIREIGVIDNHIYIGCESGGIYRLNKNLDVDISIEHHLPSYSVNTFILSAHDLISGSRDGHLNRVAFMKEEVVLKDRIPMHNYAIYKIVKSPDGKYIATASRDKSIKIWRLENLEFVTKLTYKDNDGHTASVNDLIWFGNTLVSASDDRSIIVWKVSLE
ncbi:MAG: hypothetical protein R3279_04115 [Putridiphycobacter sp.]|nr:hypothetical protein [Putridiphycobacter sp.]